MAERIRDARRADAPHIAYLHSVSWRVAYKGLLPAAYLAQLHPQQLAQRWRKTLAHGRRDTRVLVAEADGRLVGFAQTGPCRDRALAGFAGEVFMLYVHPEWHGRGLGRRLLGAAQTALERQGYYWLVIGVLEANLRAQAFYERVGLRPDGARWIDRVGGGQTAVVRYACPLNEVALPESSPGSPRPCA